MKRIDLPGLDLSQPSEVATQVELAVYASGLLISSRGSLASFPGSIHWHVKSPGQTGTLEITIWPKADQAWISVHANRGGPWIDASVEELCLRLLAS